MKGNLFKIKEGKKDLWISWCQKLETIYKEEAILTLTEEKIKREIFFIFQINQEYYTIGLKDVETGILQPNLQKEINIKHREIGAECLIPLGKINKLYDLIV